jgi:hypothetical protein
MIRAVTMTVARARNTNQPAGRPSPPETRPARLGISSGSNVPARSRGTASGTGPIPVCTVLAI